MSTKILIEIEIFLIYIEWMINRVLYVNLNIEYGLTNAES